MKQSENPDYKLLLKEYQKEIDSLNNRSKYAEAAFIDLYKKLAEIPDPCPVFAAGMVNLEKVQQIDTMNMENLQLKEKVTKLEAQVSDIPELVKRTEYLSNEVKRYKETTEQMVNDAVMQRTRELKEETEERIEAFKETEKSLQKQLLFVQNEFKSLQNSKEYIDAQHDGISVQDQEIQYKLAQVEILSRDIENWKHKFEVMGEENARLRAQIEHKEGDEVKGHYKEQMRQLENIIQSLEKELITAKAETEILESQWQSSNSEIQNTLDNTKSELNRLQAELMAKSDYEIIKNELDIFKMMENSKGNVEDGPLELILLEKNKRLETELTNLKVELDSLRVLIESKDEGMTEIQALLNEKMALISKLETDINNMYEKVTHK